jgi:hypothetical protein
MSVICQKTATAEIVVALSSWARSYAVLQSERGKRLEAEDNVSKFKIQMEIWNTGNMEHWNNETMKSCNDGINAKSSNDK